MEVERERSRLSFVFLARCRSSNLLLLLLLFPRRFICQMLPDPAEILSQTSLRGLYQHFALSSGASGEEKCSKRWWRSSSFRSKTDERFRDDG